VYGEWPPLQLDHVNGNPVDNRFANLRLASASQNSANARRPVTNTSGFKGVHLNPTSTQKWRAKITVNKVQVYLGYFDTKEEAGAAYMRAAQEHFGEFARAK
jgi:hypothetical protein